MKRLLPLLLVAAIGGCADKPTTSDPFSPASIAVVEVTTTEAISLANACLRSAVGPCGVPASRATIIAAAHEAHDAFRRLQGASKAGQPAAMAASQEALAQLTRLVPAKQ